MNHLFRNIVSVNFVTFMEHVQFTIKLCLFQAQKNVGEGLGGEFLQKCSTLALVKANADLISDLLSSSESFLQVKGLEEG
jgi:hypothetical protein